MLWEYCLRTVVEVEVDLCGDLFFSIHVLYVSVLTSLEISGRIWLVLMIFGLYWYFQGAQWNPVPVSGNGSEGEGVHCIEQKSEYVQH